MPSSLAVKDECALLLPGSIDRVGAIGFGVVLDVDGHRSALRRRSRIVLGLGKVDLPGFHWPGSSAARVAVTAIPVSKSITVTNNRKLLIRIRLPP